MPLIKSTYFPFNLYLLYLLVQGGGKPGIPIRVYRYEATQYHCHEDWTEVQLYMS